MGKEYLLAQVPPEKIALPVYLGEVLCVQTLCVSFGWWGGARVTGLRIGLLFFFLFVFLFLVCFVSGPFLK